MVYQRQWRMRCLMLWGMVIGVMGCKQPIKKITPIEIATYGVEDLQYPERKIVVSEMAQRGFLDHFFLPWNRSPETVLDTLSAFPGKELSYLHQYLNDDGWYGEHKKPHKKIERLALVRNVDTLSFPNTMQKGIVTAHTNLRRLPTHRPGFATYSNAGEGYPFDYFQETGLWANTPVRLLHITIDRQWCYVLSPYYKGWVAMRDMAIVDDDFSATWTQNGYALPLSDTLNLQQNASYAPNAKMGMVLPYKASPTESDKVLVYYAVADVERKAQIQSALVDRKGLALEGAAPLAADLKGLVSQLVGRPYGWGGSLENRDCSSMIRDLWATYKVWLPRDSKDQINIGERFELSGSPAEKIALIQEKGIPFLTILRKKGHNMLYVGNTPNGEPLIFHAIWGLKTAYSDIGLTNALANYPIEGLHEGEAGQLLGRYIIGESVITSVRAGEGNPSVVASLIDDIYAMTNFLE
ncbi:MAG: SH3 domain-containing protein [Bacteroidota bacterium]